MAGEIPNGNGYSRTNFYITVIGGACAVLVVIFGAIFWVSGIANEVNQNKESLDSQERRLNDIATDLRQSDLQTNGMTRDLKEVETQFCAADIIRNLTHASDLRNTAMLWYKVYGITYPTDNAYYPTICNRATTAQ